MDSPEAKAAKEKEARKARHAVMRKLERADWAMKEDDDDDAMTAVLAAIRIVGRNDMVWDGRLAKLPDLLGKAVVIVLEGSLTGEVVGQLHKDAYAMLVREGENYRGCDYGM
jgi:hypothetical protein